MEPTVLVLAACSLVFVVLAFLAGRALARQAEAAAIQAARGAAEAELSSTRASLTATLAGARSAAEAQRADLSSRLAELEAALGEERRRVTALTGELSEARTRLEAARATAAERVVEAERARQQVRAEIEVLATRLLEEKGKVMLDRSQAGLESLLEPLGEKLKAFEEKVERAYDTDLRDRASLLAQLGQLQEAQVRLHADADNLTRALSGQSKVQGDWGELVLERVLETAGLTEGREYDLQSSHTDEEGHRKRPDALIYLPEDRAIVVDAKCSLTAFLQATRALDDQARQAALADHVRSVRAHVAGLAGKRYQDVLQQRTLDVVLLFVPNEAAFQAALTSDAALYGDAFRQGIILCSPTTLLAALQLVAHVWRSERQGQNAQRIAEEAGRLLEKFEGFVADVTAIGARLDQAQDAYQDARKKLDTGKGNLVRKASQLLELGARVKSPKALALLASTAPDDDQEDGQPMTGVDGAVPDEPAPPALPPGGPAAKA